MAAGNMAAGNLVQNTVWKQGNILSAYVPSFFGAGSSEKKRNPALKYVKGYNRRETGIFKCINRETWLGGKRSTRYNNVL